MASCAHIRQNLSRVVRLFLSFFFCYYTRAKKLSHPALKSIATILSARDRQPALIMLADLTTAVQRGTVQSGSVKVETAGPRLSKEAWEGDSDKGRLPPLLALLYEAEVTVLDRRGSAFHVRNAEVTPNPHFVILGLLISIVSKRKETRPISHHFVKRNEMV